MSPHRNILLPVCYSNSSNIMPGEALNILLRVLNERKFGSASSSSVTSSKNGTFASDGFCVDGKDYNSGGDGTNIPLLSAIATGSPPPSRKSSNSNSNGNSNSSANASSSSFGEELDPATLDRFTLQVCLFGTFSLSGNIYTALT